MTKVKVENYCKENIEGFLGSSSGQRTAITAWYQESSKAEWEGPYQIKLEYPSASLLADNRVVFNIKGNHYRLIVKINYDYQMIWIRFVGTHSEYDKINAKTI